jgi:hypothetical protein
MTRKKFSFGRTLLVLTFALTLLFQVHLLWRSPVLGAVLDVLFWLLLALLAAALVEAAGKDKFLWVFVVLVVLVRVPFFLQGDGLMSNSDNALEALQAVEIQESGRAPFYLLGALSHIGTVKYSLVAAVWDLTGPRYVWLPVFQTVLFVVFLVLLGGLLKPVVERPALRTLLLSQFVFVEVFFDYSLSLRGGPYLELLVCVLLAFKLLLAPERTAVRVFLGAYFVAFAVYLHPLAALFGVWWVAALVWILWKRGMSRAVAAGAAAVGAAAGGLAFLAYRIGPHPPVDEGPYSQLDFFAVFGSSAGEAAANIGRAAKHLWTAFRNLHGMEYAHARDFLPAAASDAVFETIHRVAVPLSAAMVVAALAVLVRPLIGRRAWADGRRPPGSGFRWLMPALLLTAVGRTYLMTPKPYLEPRHNLDLGFAVALGYALVLGEVLKSRRPRWLPGAAVAALLVLALPQALAYYRMSAVRAESYRELMGVLRTEKIRALSTDFNLAYAVHFLSRRRIPVSDSTGPFTIRLFYPGMRAEVDRLPDEEKAYLFYRPDYIRSRWHLRNTEIVLGRLVKNLDDRLIPYRQVLTRDFVLIVPGNRFPGPSPQGRAGPSALRGRRRA